MPGRAARRTKGQHPAMNWDTADGINAYCELHGDMYIVDANNVRYCPDTGITENPLPEGGFLY